MKKKNKKGFTLVELLAVIVILAIILVISVPKITDVIDSARSGSLESTAKMVAAGAETWYQTELVLNGGEASTTPACNEVAKINESDYNSCTIEFVDGKAYVTIAGKGKFEEMSICKGTKSSATVVPSCGVIAREYIENLHSTAANDNGLYKDPTTDQNIRYTGLYPKNYVLFNNELWRIIGIFNVSNGTMTEKRVKLIREESIGEYSWDSSAGSGTAAFGVNNWVLSDLNKVLNDYYYNGKDNQKCYNGQNNAQTDCSFGSITLNDTSKSLIDDTVWTIGANTWDNTDSNPTPLNTLTQYARERDTRVYTAGRPTTHKAKIGLIFPTDFGYASTDADCKINLRSGTWNGATYAFKCGINNWLQTGYYYWTITPSLADSWAAFEINLGGFPDVILAYYARNVRPVLYLKSNAVIIDGTGTNSDPYELSLRS